MTLTDDELARLEAQLSQRPNDFDKDNTTVLSLIAALRATPVAEPEGAIGTAILSFEGDDAGPLGHSHLWFCQCSDTSIPRHSCVTPVADTAGIDAAWDSDLTNAEIERLANALARADYMNWGSLGLATMIAGTVRAIAADRLAAAPHTPKPEGEPAMSFIESFQRDHPSEPEK